VRAERERESRESVWFLLRVGDRGTDGNIAATTKRPEERGKWKQQLEQKKPGKLRVVKGGVVALDRWV
jgi:hypothetical protein